LPNSDDEPRRNYVTDKDAKVTSKEGKGDTLIIVGVRVAEDEATPFGGRIHESSNPNFCATP
jgi:hypothetical protein